MPFTSTRASFSVSAFGGIGGASRPGFDFTYTPAVNVTDVNLRTLALAAGWNGTVPLSATVIINPGILVCQNTGAAALDTGTLPANSSLTLINSGNITGKGGNASAGGLLPGNGTPGGNAINTNANVVIFNNPSGVIAGAGGGGAGGISYSSSVITVPGSGGGGGGGCSPGTGGSGGTAGGRTGNSGQPGTATLGGAGGAATIIP